MNLFSCSGCSRSGLLFVLLELDGEDYNVVSTLGGSPASEKRLSDAEWAQEHLDVVGVEDALPLPKIIEERPKSLLVTGHMQSERCGEYGRETDEYFDVVSVGRVVTPEDIREVLNPLLLASVEQTKKLALKRRWFVSAQVAEFGSARESRLALAMVGIQRRECR